MADVLFGHVSFYAVFTCIRTSAHMQEGERGARCVWGRLDEEGGRKGRRDTLDDSGMAEEGINQGREVFHVREDQSRRGRDNQDDQNGKRINDRVVGTLTSPIPSSGLLHWTSSE